MLALYDAAHSLQLGGLDRDFPFIEDESILLNIMYLRRWETEVTSTPTRPVDNVVIPTKGLQDRNIHILDGTTVKNKGKLILIEDETQWHFSYLSGIFINR